jgi:DNA polymerase III delta prime subunit
LVNISKRPVILTANSENCQHLAKFIQQKSIIFESPNTRSIAKWLKILCLAENWKIELTDDLYELKGHDLRKTINAIEFFIKSHQQQSDNLFNFYYKMNCKIQQQLQCKRENCNRIFNWRFGLNTERNLEECKFFGELASESLCLQSYDQFDRLQKDLGLEIQEYLASKSEFDMKSDWVEDRSQCCQNRQIFVDENVSM